MSDNDLPDDAFQQQEADRETERRGIDNKGEKKVPLVVGERGYIVPQTPGQALRMARAVIQGGLAPDSYNRDENKIMLGIMAALEAGLPPLYGLRNIAIIQGRPVIWGDAAMALVQSKSLISEYREAMVGQLPADNDLAKWPDDFGYLVTLRRKGQSGEYVGEFTVGMAKRAKLWLNAKKPPWIEHPTRMLKIRARSWALRDGFADALAGLAIREEVEDTFGPEDRHVEIDLDAAPAVEAPPMPEEGNAHEKS